MENVNKQLLDALKEMVSIVEIHSEATDNNFAWAELSYANEAISAAEQAQQAEPVAWEVRNGFVTHDFYKTAEDAEEVARDMQKSHDLSGSIAAFNVRPVYAQPPAVAVAALLNDLSAYAPLSGSLCAPTALQGFAIRAAIMLAAMEQPK